MDCFLFSGIEEDELEKISNIIGQPIPLKRGEELYRCGNLGIIIKGSAKISRRTETGQTVTMRNMQENEIFGAASLFGEWGENLSSITAATPCKVIYISGEVFKKLCADYPVIAFNYITFLTDRIRFLNRKIDTFSADSTEQRLYEFLISKADSQNRVELEFGLAELARRLKIGRSSLYRSIESLEKNNLIKRDNKTFTLL